MGLTRFVAALVVLLLTSVISRAAVTVSASYGWNSAYRPGHWTPVFITVASDKPRQVLIELYAPHDRTFGMTPHILATATPQPRTYAMFVPLNTMVHDAVVTVKEPGTWRKLADTGLVPDSSVNRYAVDFENTAAGDMALIGIAGARAIPALKHIRAANHEAVVGALAIEDLPGTAIGYDGLDVLVLPNPNFANLTLDQQTAMVEWVKSGGRLILLPGESTVPAGSVLESILPASLGDVTMLDLPANERTSLHLPERFAHMHARQLQPSGDARELKLLGTATASAFYHRVGFGQAMVFPFDASQLSLEADAGKRFWQPVIEAICPLLQSDVQQNEYASGVGTTRRNTTINPLMEMLGDVPGVGRFDFSYVAYSLIGLMLLVGPVDWFVLKRIGRQPWTWLTTTGWVLLLTTVALLLGQSLRSGDLYFRTIDVVDEADGAAVARTTMAGMYSPKTDNYTIASESDSWWQPLSATEEGYYFGPSSARDDVSFMQTYQGNLPDPMRVNIWDLRFLEGAMIGAAPAKISATLSMKDDHCVGTITNNGDTPMSYVTIRTSRGTAEVKEAIAPGKSLAIDLQVAISERRRFEARESPYAVHGLTKPSLGEMTLLAGNLATERSQEIEQFVTHGEYACVYAMMETPAGAAHLSPAPVIENHYVVIRSLVPLNKP